MGSKDTLQPDVGFELIEVKSGAKLRGTILDLQRAFREQGIMFPSGSQTPTVGLDFLYADQSGKLGRLDDVQKVIEEDDGTIRIATRKEVYTLSILSE